MILLLMFINIFKKLLSCIKFLLKFIFVFIIVCIIFITGVYFYFSRGLPDIKSLEDYKPPVLTQVIADDGKTVIGEFWNECRIFLPYKKIPQKLIQAFVASEDSRFFEHRGVDMRSIARAFIANLKAREITQGASTITQQVTRSILLSPERTITRKIKEAILATRLERTLDKEQILTLYLNQIFLGNRAYGVAAAARNYFHKTVDELTLAETALIAGLPSAPIRFSPLNNSIQARERQLHVLDRMVEVGLINLYEKQEALEEKLKVFPAGVDKDFSSNEAGYFIEHVRRLIKDKYGDKALYFGGLKVFTTVNVEKQMAAYQSIKQGLEKIAKRQGFSGPIDHISLSEVYKYSAKIKQDILERQKKKGIIWPNDSNNMINHIIFDGQPYKAIVVDFLKKDVQVLVGDVTGIIPFKNMRWARNFSTKRANYDDENYISDPQKVLKQGDVILVKYLKDNEFDLFEEPKIQGALFSMDPHTSEVKALVGGYDFSQSEFNRATQAIRQPGSAFKPFVYAAALDKGYSYNTTIMDAPVSYVIGKNQVWKPKNYGGEYKGPTLFENALVFSRNVPTVKIVADIGIDYLTAYVRKLGITSQIDRYLSMALGANGVSLNELVGAYATFLNHGVYKNPIFIRKVVDASGVILQEIEKDQRINKAIGSGIISGEDSLNIEKNELNTDLFLKNKIWLEKDKLDLSKEDLKTLYGTEIAEGYVMTPKTAYLMVKLLEQVVQRGTGVRVRELGVPVAGKTGTTNDETDTWFVGFVPDLVSGVWIGFDEAKPIGRRETGGRTAAPLFLEYMKKVVTGYEKKEFEPPIGFSKKDISTLIGGSAVYGPRIVIENIDMETYSDRAGLFFEEDAEEYGQEKEDNIQEEFGF